MKRLLISIPILALGLSLQAQTMDDALRYSDNNYYGTARTIAMGNAFTALGGDLGSIGINPAGSAVNSFAQLTITPGFSSFKNTSVYNTQPVHSSKPSAGSLLYNRKGNLTLPNLGFNMVYRTGLRKGLKSIAMGVTINTTNVYSGTAEASGTNWSNSICGDMAMNTDGIHYSALESFDSAPWPSVIGWKSGMISTYGGNDNQYIGSTENIDADGTIGLARPVDQKYGRITTGSKQDVLFNLAFNISDNFYIGANIGVNTFNYNYDSYIAESVDPNIDPDDPLSNAIEYDNGTVVYFRSAEYRQRIAANGTGIYAKIGAIWAPTSSFRFGAAIQTPTATVIKESWMYSGEINFDNPAFFGHSNSPEGTYEYRLSSPLIADLGAAFIIPGVGLISADYEYSDFSKMVFKTREGYRDEFSATNADIRNNMQAVHKFRLGAEYQTPLRSCIVSYRAGFNLSSSPYISSGPDKIDPTMAVSAGIGFSTQRSFFADIALRNTWLPNDYIYPYGSDVVPEVVLSDKRIFDLAVTFGWRF